MRVVVEGGGDPGGDVAQVLEVALVRAIAVPELRQAVAAGGGEAAILGEGDPLRAAAVGAPTLDLGAVLHFPEACRAVFGGGGQDVGVEPPVSACDQAGVAAEVVKLAPGFGFPDQQAAVAIA